MSFQDDLLQWFQKNQRPLPWRKHYRPYEVWISEIMLQQTQVETALPYYGRWFKLFPSIRSLAESNEHRVLKGWEGLGYYSRARNLHASAKVIMEKFKGQFPENFDDILSLKGVGRYTAGAIASIAFNQDKPIVDGNVLRVLSRLYAIDKPIDVGENKKLFWELQEKLIPKGKARYFNQSLMELGALICTKQNPSCRICPVAEFCKAYKQGNPDNYPVKKHKKQMTKVEATALVIKNEGKYFIHKRPVGKIMGGLWEFPEWKSPMSKKLLLSVKKDLGVEISKVELIGKIRRNYTHHLETLNVFRINSKDFSALRSQWPSAWATKKNFRKYPFSSAHVKITELL